MRDGPVSRSAPQAGHLEGVNDELGAQVIGDRPADDTTGPGIDDHGEIDPALGRGALGDVLDPQPVRSLRAEPAVHQVVRWRVGHPSTGAADRASPAADALQATFPHQPLDPLAVHPAAEPES
jgi:hypothetical protein